MYGEQLRFVVTGLGVERMTPGGFDAVMARIPAAAEQLAAAGADATRTATPTEAPPAPAPAARDTSVASRLAQLETELQRRFMEEGIVVRGHDVARVVSVATGRSVQWTES